MSSQLYGDDTPADVKNAKVCTTQRLGMLLEHRRINNLAGSSSYHAEYAQWSESPDSPGGVGRCVRDGVDHDHDVHLYNSR